VTISSGTAATAYATSPPITTLYVDNANSACSDAGTGTAAVPFCTIQAAADVVTAGQTVVVSPTSTDAVYNEDVSVTQSGTPADPITFTVGVPWVNNGLSPSVSLQPTGQNHQPLDAGFTLDGVHDVVIQGFGIFEMSDAGISIRNSTDITVDHDSIGRLLDPYKAQNGVTVSGTSNHVTISRTFFDGPYQSVLIGPGAVDTTVTTNEFDGGNATNNGIIANGATNTVITSNTWSGEGCLTPIAVTDSPTTTIENNAIYGQCNTPPAPPLISVDAASVTGSELDYNVEWTNGTVPLYSWAGTPYSTASALTTATGQGVHELFADPINADIDSADALTPGELATDINGSPRVDDPLVPNTGTGVGYYDRGAVETQDPMNVGLTLSALQAPVGGQITAHIAVTGSWSDDPTGTINFGDGSATVSTLTSATHTYTATGTYTVTAIGNDGQGGQQTATQTITIVPLSVIQTSLTVTPQAALSATIDASATNDSWAITGTTVDYGDGSALYAEASGAPIAQVHKYSKPGTYTVTVTFCDASSTCTPVQQQITTTGSAFTAFGPVRLLDTRNGTGTGGKVAKIPSQGIVTLQIAGNGSIPSGVTAVALNLTATNTVGSGFVTAYADGTTTPNVSNLNYTPGRTVPNSVIVPVGADGKIDLFNGGGSAGPIDLIADVTGYFTRTAASGYTAVSPDRLLDTRVGTGTGGKIAKVGAGKSIALTIADADGGILPTAGITAVALNVTTTNTTGSGFITAYPGGGSVPNSSNLNYVAGQTVANAVIVPVSPNGTIDLYNGGALAGSVDLIADVTGYFSASGASAYIPVTPVRMIDTRTTSVVARDGEVTVAPDAHLPAGTTNATGFAVNVTVTQPTGSGFISVYPDGTAVPNVSTVNYTPNLTIANLALATPGADQKVDFYNGGGEAGSTQLIVDLFGYFSAN